MVVLQSGEVGRKIGFELGRDDEELFVLAKLLVLFGRWDVSFIFDVRSQSTERSDGAFECSHHRCRDFRKSVAWDPNRDSGEICVFARFRIVWKLSEWDVPSKRIVVTFTRHCIEHQGSVLDRSRHRPDDILSLGYGDRSVTSNQASCRLQPDDIIDLCRGHNTTGCLKHCV